MTTAMGLLAAAVTLSSCSSNTTDADSQTSGTSADQSSGTQASPTSPSGTAEPVHYVALGDSFVAGPGIGNTTGVCQRSTKNFPSLVARKLKAASFTDASCSGATIASYTVRQGENPPQYDALDEKTTLVTLGTVGGNNVGLVQVAAACAVGECGTAGVQDLKNRIDALQPMIVDSVAQVRTRAPKARILLIGYGTYLPKKACAALPSVTTAEMRYLQGTVDRLSDTIEAAAKETGVEFVDMRKIPGARRHTACAPMAKQWIRGLDDGGDGMVFHPSTAGMAVMARQVEATLAS